jgi:hypothetical protein
MDQNEDTRKTRARPVKRLQPQPIGMLLSAFLINKEIEHHPGENG